MKAVRRSYSSEDTEDIQHCTVAGVAVGEGRYNLEVTQARAGNWVLLRGLGNAVQGTATVVARNVAEAAIFKPLEFGTQALLKLAIEPRKPSELPVMVEALRKVTRTYPLVRTKVEESGEYTVFGTGELQLDCALYDLRHVYSSIDIKVSNPMVRFTETVQEKSSLLCFAETPNRMNRLAMTAEPLEKGLADDGENEIVSAAWPPQRFQAFLQQKYGWDKLAARSVWAFGPEATGANVLLNDTLPSEVDAALLGDVRGSVVQGFRWARGPAVRGADPQREVQGVGRDAVGHGDLSRGWADHPHGAARGVLGLPAGESAADGALLPAGDPGAAGPGGHLRGDFVTTSRVHPAGGEECGA